MKKKPALPAPPAGPTSITILGNEYRTGDEVIVVTPEFGAMATCIKGMKYNPGQKPYAAWLGWVCVPGLPGAICGNHGSMSISGFEQAEPDTWWQQRGYTEFWLEIYMVIFSSGIHLGQNKFGPSYPRHWPSVFNWRCKPADHRLVAEGPAYRVDHKWIGYNQWETMKNPQPLLIERPLSIEKAKPTVPVQLQLF
ncbi:hypothetical protein [Spirosoma aerolatum]|uniref:hypothetical protein n=1 Tax=Spirosoma aerolatum TaxID=1211326 RepID=UPI0009AF0875|nr:hypothetical protein [Spirosoma aerolatum]